jgi:hypothetical protein
MKQCPDGAVDPERVADLAVFYYIMVKADEDDFPVQVRVLDQWKTAFCKDVHKSLPPGEFFRHFLNNAYRINNRPPNMQIASPGPGKGSGKRGK